MPSKNFLSKYNDPVEYDSTFTGSTHDESYFYLNYIKKFKEILYLGSGTGRLLTKFLAVNRNIIAVDFSKEMVHYSRKRLPNANILQEDVLKLNLNKQFYLILAPYRFIAHFDYSELKRLFNIISKHLAVNGYFVGDIFSPYLPHDRTIKCEIESVQKHKNIVEKTYNCYDHKNQICTEIIEKINIKTGGISLIEMPWHYYYPKQLKTLAKGAGLEIKGFYGSFNKESFNKNSYDLIFVIKKKKT